MSKSKEEFKKALEEELSVNDIEPQSVDMLKAKLFAMWGYAYGRKEATDIVKVADKVLALNLGRHMDHWHELSQALKKWKENGGAI